MNNEPDFEFIESTRLEAQRQVYEEFYKDVDKMMERAILGFSELGDAFAYAAQALEKDLRPAMERIMPALIPDRRKRRRILRRAKQAWRWK